MKDEYLLILGNGNPHSVAFNTCILVNENILLDAPPGVEKVIMGMQKNLKALNAILISHTHGDHTLGLPQLLVYCGRVLRRTETLYLVGPIELEGNLRAIYDLTFPGEADDIFNSANVKFIPLSESVVDISLAGYRITCLKMSHGAIDNYGYLVYTNAQIIGYSGDTGPCKNLDVLIDRADHILLDMTFLKTRDTHTGVDYLQKVVPRLHGMKKLYAIHRGEETENIISLPGIILPKSGDVYHL
jgi:ribonuclease BN (tRNA processing enzyme)